MEQRIAFRNKAEKERQNDDGKTIIEKLSFAQFIPQPQEIKDTTSPNTTNPKEMIKKYGAKDWYDWNLKHWGVKWDVDSAEREETDKHLKYFFDTAWGPPDNGIQNISKSYPLLTFLLRYHEPGMNLKGKIKFKNGEILEEKET